MKLNSKTQATFILSALLCLCGYCQTSQAVKLTGTCPVGHDMEEMHGKHHMVSPKLADAECSNCHGNDGNGVNANDDVPNLAGQEFMYLCAWLDACRKKGTQCKSHEDIAARLSTTDIAGLSMYYSHLPSLKW